jgi:biotin carboxylase
MSPAKTQIADLTPAKVLLCDPAFSAMPLLAALKAAGFYVAVTGARPGDPCHWLADMSLQTDYSNREALLAVTREHAFDYIVPGCTDVSYISAAWVARVLDLPGFDEPAVIEMIQDKGRFRAYAKDHHYPVPRATSDILEAALLAFPILIKPVDSFSGKGIQKIVNADGLDEGYRNAILQSPSGQVLFEEFVEGQLFSHSAFIRDGVIVGDFFVKEYCTVHPYQVNSSCLATRLEPMAVQKMRDWLKTFMHDANLCDGLMHTQFISKNGDISLIESTRRCPGDLYSRLIEISTGIDYAAQYIDAFCGRAIRPVAPLLETKPISRYTVSLHEDCHFVDVTMSMPNVGIAYVPIRKSGEFMRAAPFDRAGIYFIEHASLAIMEEMTERIVEHVNVNRIIA